MSLSRSSKATALLAVLVLAAAAVGTVSAVSVDSADVPQEAKAGSEVSASFTLTELYQNPQWESWSLNGTTELQNVTWTIEYYDQTGSQIDAQTVDGQNISVGGISTEQDVSEVKVVMTGDTPALENYNYEEKETFLVASLTQTRQNGNSNQIDSWSAHHFTEESKQARNEIQSAEQAIGEASDAGADVSGAESTLNNAVSAYENGNFPNAIDLANQAEQNANDAQQQKESSEQTTQMLMYGGVGLVVLLLIGGVVYWYRSQQDEYDKLG